MSPRERLQRADQPLFIVAMAFIVAPVLLGMGRRMVHNAIEDLEIAEEQHRAEVHGLRSRLDSLLEQLHEQTQGGSRAEQGADPGGPLADPGPGQG